MNTAPREGGGRRLGDRIRHRLEERTRRESALSPQRCAYREAAALLTRFDPTRLRLPGTDDIGGAILSLVDDCVSIGAGNAPVWTLKPGIREATLRGFSGPEQARRALAANAGDYGPGPERIAVAYLARDTVDLATMDTPQLSAALQAVLWLAQVPGMTGVPEPDQIRNQLDHRRLFQSFDNLLREPFLGRLHELDELRSYAGILEPETLHGKRKSVQRRVSSALRRRDGRRLPLVVYGAGGIGKSTLLAKFVIDHVRRPGRRIPFVYIDFERPTVSLREPLTLVAEAASQLSVQFPELRAELGQLAEECHAAARRQRQEQQEVEELHEIATTWASRGRTLSAAMHSQSLDEESGYMGRLAAMVARTAASPAEAPPFLVVLDSFEQAQYRDNPVLDRMWSMFDALQRAYPLARVAVAGRAPVGHPATRAGGLQKIELGEFDHDAAAGFLAALGVADPELAHAIAARIGGNPLSLKLAAGVVARDRNQSREWLKEIPSKRRWLIRSIDDMLIQGMLYDRILNHIGDDEVRRLAHPGLVLRRITPEIIKGVLAPQCGIDVENIEQAERLFDKMARELDLLEQVRPGVLEHRSDVRRVMLRLLATDRSAATEAIERGAIAFYSASDEPEDRAEEIYHRLRLRESPRSVLERWIPGVEPYLRTAVEELPPRAASFLSARLGEEVPGDALAGADQEDWELITAREVENLLQQDYVAEAVRRLRERADWTLCSPLHALYAEALIRQGQAGEARRFVSRALARPAAETCGETYLELLLLAARLEEMEGDLNAADADLLVAERVATSLDRELDALGALLERARVHQVSKGNVDEADAALARRVRAIPERTLARRPALLRAVAAEVGEQEPSLLAYVLDLVGLPATATATVVVLARAIRDAAESQPRLRQALDALLGAGHSAHGTAGQLDRAEVVLSEAQRRGELNRLAKDLLAVRDDSGVLRSGVAAAMGAGAPAGAGALPPQLSRAVVPPSSSSGGDGDERLSR